MNPTPILTHVYDSLDLRKEIEAIVASYHYATLEDAERHARKTVKWISKVKGLLPEDSKPTPFIRDGLVMLGKIQKARAEDIARIKKEQAEAAQAAYDARANSSPDDDVQELKEEKFPPFPDDADGAGDGDLEDEIMKHLNTRSYRFNKNKLRHSAY